MFKSLPMRHVELVCLASERQDVALALARHGRFGPAGPARAEAEYRELYRAARTRLDKLMAYCGDHPMAPIPEDAIAPNLRELTGIDHRLAELWQVCNTCQEQARRLDEARARLDSLRETYTRLAALEVGPERLLRRDGLLEFRLGQVPVANLKRLSEALSVAHFVLTEFDRAGDQAFVAVAGPRAGDGARLGGLLAQAGWRELPVPTELRTDPASAARFLAEQATRLEAEAAGHCELRDQQARRHGAWLGQARALLALAEPLAASSLRGLSESGQLVAFVGWVPRRALAGLRAALDVRFKGRYLLVARAPEPGEPVPTLVEYPAWLRPFTGLARAYGVPRYGEFDPALLAALGYLILFGAMFGDVGHGAMLVLVACLPLAALDRLRAFLAGAGLASIGFGVLYGSVFGIEDWLPAVWLSPMHDPVRLLGLAVMFGAGFIGLTLVLRTANLMAERRWRQAWLDGGGLAGLALYVGLGVALQGSLAGSPPDWAAGLAGAGGLAVILGALIAGEGGWAERSVVAAMEAVETVIGLAANTLSFLRVAAFGLNHVALSLAVWVIADSVSGVGQVLALALGHALIVALEGGIVAIQAMRLMYYEGFSRFFAGDGFAFRPLRLADPPTAAVHPPPVSSV